MATDNDVKIGLGHMKPEDRGAKLVNLRQLMEIIRLFVSDRFANKVLVNEAVFLSWGLRSMQEADILVIALARTGLGSIMYAVMHRGVFYRGDR